MFFFCVLFLKDSLFLISSWKTGVSMSCTQFSGLRSWEGAPAWIPFSNSLQWLPSVTLLQWNLFSYAPLTQDMNAFWPFEDCYLLGFVFVQFFFFNCLKLPCMKIYKHAFLQTKHPCFTRDLDSLHPSSHQLQSPGPGLQRPWQSNRELKKN